MSLKKIRSIQATDLGGIRGHTKNSSAPSVPQPRHGSTTSAVVTDSSQGFSRLTSCSETIAACAELGGGPAGNVMAEDLEDAARSVGGRAAARRGMNARASTEGRIVNVQVTENQPTRIYDGKGSIDD